MAKNVFCTRAKTGVAERPRFKKDFQNFSLGVTRKVFLSLDQRNLVFSNRINNN